MKRIIFAMVFGIAAFSAVAQENVYSSSGKPMSEYRKRQQEKEKGFNKDNLVFGGGMVLGFSSGIINIGVTPIIGYRFTEKFAAGIGLGYQYYEMKNAIPYYDSITLAPKYYTFKSHIYSASIWARYLLLKNIFVHVEPEMNSFEQVYNPDNFTIYKERIFVPCLLMGAGIRQPVSDRTSIMATILYDVLQYQNSPYLNRIDFRIGVSVGF
jgi:hypothetical protein